ncbi:TonB-dependent receptor [Elizabethkingia miricola]|uniref:TonB-dependent receptor n=1 Tax=Elizabethkingia miricola TaxID=172045 RepID=A0ABD5B743_ELIMR|nr:TonB-dependent receptor [Elizabethkingia miricola]MDQ8749633.1 TonB-dependent receptor [Elizabethkingia miricola]NHQ68047.1 TonB-dependent receptor [Elizabethkingia miricola]NHQ71772.1 TonB-dependent receptor [Elizabethkingia miricola]NHQ79457.1 TonB-dependent receptor [Elizabethkingia miricola]OPB90278.1 TonB-dependent receptor [Elizabethkingia miricola]
MKDSTGFHKWERGAIKVSVFFLLASFGSIHAQTIKGTVVSKVNGALPGANISIIDADAKAVSSLDGDFNLLSPRLGEVKLKVEYIGYQTQTLSVVLKEGTNDIGYVSIEPEDKKSKDKISSIEGVVISTRANALTQAKAYEIKKNSNAIMEVIAADAIGKLPDRNAAEAVQRVQGVAVARYHGEADQATVRGTPFAWTSTLFNGNRLPSANVLGNRSFVLDVVPSELIQYVQVSKAVTPDMDGDAIGGSINFITRTAPAKKMLSVSGAGGYNTFSRNGTYNGSIVYGDRFFKNKLGVILSGAIWDRQWGADSFDASYNTGAANEVERKSISTVMMKRYMGTRRTIGLNGGLEYKLNANNKIYFRGMFNKFDDIRPVYESYVDYTNSRYQYNFRYSHYQTELYGMELGGEHSLSSKISLDWMLSNYKADYFLNTPPTNETKGLPIATFRQKITSGFNNLTNGKRYWGFDSPEGIGGEYLDYGFDVKDQNEKMSPDKLLLSQLVIAKLDNSELDKIARLNLKYDISPDVTLRIGAKYREKDRNSTYGYSAVYLPGASVGIPNTPALLALSQLSTTEPAKGVRFLNGMNGDYSSYVMNPPSKDQLFQMYSSEFLQKNGFGDFSNVASNATSVYTGEESVFATYAMAEIKAGDKLKIIGGFRNETTRLTLNGAKSTKEGNSTVISPSVVESNYNAFLPMLHLRYNLSSQANLRFAYTRSFIRPNFGDMSPGSSIDNTTNPFTITRGNPDLRPTFSHNLDLMGEYYFKNIGILSGGVFYKKISDIVFSDTSVMNIGGTDYRVTQSKNLQDSNLIGFEAGINKRFDFLPGFWNGFGVEFNYTFINSNVEVPRTDKNGVQYFDKTSLPNQSKNLFNAILYYENKKLMLRLAGNYRGKSVETINQNLGPQYYIWSDKNFTIDFSASYDISKSVKLFVELNNLGNESLRQYMGDNKKRITSHEWYGSRGQLGIRWQIF